MTTRMLWWPLLLLGLLVCTARADEAAADPVVEGATPVEEETPIDVIADKLTVLNRENRATFVGHVVVTTGDTVLRCERLDVTHEDSGRVRTLQCEGGVHIQRGDREAFGETALFQRRPDRIQLMGDPLVREPRGELRGQEIWLYLDDDRVVVKAARGSFQLPGLTGGTR